MQAISLSPSFSSYSNCKIAEIAGRIVDESDLIEFPNFENRKNSADSEGGISDEEFEFSTVKTDPELQIPAPADEIFQNGKIRFTYPVFNRDLLNFHEEKNRKIRVPLRKLFLEERETALTTSSSSSSESDDLDGVIGESYCEWPPKKEAAKSGSAGGNLKRCKLKDFLRRSNSDGIKTNLMVQFHGEGGKKKEIKKVTEMPAERGNVKSAAAMHGGEKERSSSYIMRRQDLAGLFVV